MTNEKERVRAAAAGQTDWGAHGSDQMLRYARLDKRMRRRCLCGQRATHWGATNGVALMSGCEMCVARWVRDPAEHYRRLRRSP